MLLWPSVLKFKSGTDSLTLLSDKGTSGERAVKAAKNKPKPNFAKSGQLEDSVVIKIKFLGMGELKDFTLKIQHKCKHSYFDCVCFESLVFGLEETAGNICPPRPHVGHHFECYQKVICLL